MVRKVVKFSIENVKLDFQIQEPYEPLILKMSIIPQKIGDSKVEITLKQSPEWT